MDSIAGWAIIAVMAVVALWMVLRITRKVIALSVRLAILLGAVLVIVAALYLLSRVWISGGLPVS